MTHLDCGRIGIYLTERGDSTTIVADLTRLVEPGARCGRALNDISTARITLRDCYDGVTVQPWVHSLLFLWGNQRLWYGPIVSIADTEFGAADIEALDIMGWMRRRKLRTAFDSTVTPVDAADAFETIVSDAFDDDPSVAYTIVGVDTTIDVEREYLTTENRYVYDIITEIVATGCDFVVVDETIYVGDVEASVSPIAGLNIAHFKTKPTVRLDGMETANFVTMMGDDGLEEIVQDAGSQTTYGLLDLVESEPDILDSTSLTAAAQSRLNARRTPPVLIEAVKLLPDAPVDHADLIPGVEFEIDTGGIHVRYQGLARLQSVEFVDEDNDGRWAVTLNCNVIDAGA